MDIKRVTNIEDAEICDNFLTGLINYESSIDKLINNKYIVKDFYRRALSNNNQYLALALENNVPVGFIYAYRKINKGTSFSDNIIEIDGLFIKEDRRKNGIGTALIKNVEEWAKATYETAHIEITYINGNTPAQKCYEKLGFTPIKTMLRKKL
jgi:GNAT superfamily N-acetyltransferase